MARVRVSTTVDADRLERGRELVGSSDSKVLDAALAALIESREREALLALPYEADAELGSATFDGPDLPYDGAVPDDVLRLAEERRAGR